MSRKKMRLLRYRVRRMMTSRSVRVPSGLRTA